MKLDVGGKLAELDLGGLVPGVLLKDKIKASGLTDRLEEELELLELLAGSGWVGFVGLPGVGRVSMGGW